MKRRAVLKGLLVGMLGIHLDANARRRSQRYTRAKAKGLAVHSMPPGSPGMEGAHTVPYDVLLIASDGRYAVYKHYN